MIFWGDGSGCECWLRSDLVAPRLDRRKVKGYYQTGNVSCMTCRMSLGKTLSSCLDLYNMNSFTTAVSTEDILVSKSLESD